MIPANPKLKALEAAVEQAIHLIKENARLHDAVRRLEADNKRLKEELRGTQSSRSRNDKLRTRLEKLAQKLEKIG